jgi:hypothetical protein
MNELSGMTVHERFYQRGLLSDWDAARLRKDRGAMIQLLGQVDLADQAAWIVDTILGPTTNTSD